MEFSSVPMGFPSVPRGFPPVPRGLYVSGVRGSTGGCCCQYFEACLTVTEFYGDPWSFRRYLWGFRRYLGGFRRYLGVYRGLYVRGIPGSTGEYREYRGGSKTTILDYLYMVCMYYYSFLIAIEPCTLCL